MPVRSSSSIQSVPRPRDSGLANSGLGVRPLLIIISLLRAAYSDASSRSGTFVAFCTDTLAETERWLSPALPRLVVIITTPLAPREPYIAAAEASFNTSNRSTSAMLMAFSPRSVGTPSMTTSGSQLLIEPSPRILMLTLSPGFPASIICTPEIFPCTAAPMLLTDVLLISLLPSEATEPVRSLFFIVP